MKLILTKEVSIISPKSPGIFHCLVKLITDKLFLKGLASIRPRPLTWVRGMCSGKLDKVGAVDIESAGRFKYILIKVYCTADPATEVDKESFKYVVRGWADCPYHGEGVEEVRQANLDKI